jgi:rRNA-processing protein FCF1
MEILIDTNFAITCTRQKIDFFNIGVQMVEEQVIWILPDKILEEIKKISKTKGKTIKDRQSASLFLDILSNHKKGKAEIKNVVLKKENIDDALVDYCKKNPKVVLATLDKKLKSRVENKILTLKGKRFLRFV